MRIAITLNASWNIVNFRLGLLRALARDGHEIVAIAPRDRFSERIPFEYHELPMVADGMNPASEFAMLVRLIRLYRRIRPDVVLHFTPKPNIYGSLAARLLGIPAISNVAGLGSTFAKSGALRSLIMFLYRVSLGANARVFFQNAEDMELFVQNGLVSSAIAARLPGSGIDLASFSPRLKRRSEEPTRFLLISRLLFEKGIADFAEAARQALAGGICARFTLAGFLDARNPGAVPKSLVNDWVAEGTLDYIGPQDDVREAMANADCIVLPSYYREGVPRCLLEAAAMGKPLIAYDNVGARDVVEHSRNGWLVPSRDVSALARTMAEFTRLPATERARMGAAARAKVEREFDEAFIVQAYRSALGAVAPGWRTPETLPAFR
jgi:glycosyltransferase involved in cell wall biosynthesis